MPPALVFFFKIASAIQGLFWFHTNFRIICSSSVKNVGVSLIGIAIRDQFFFFFFLNVVFIFETKRDRA